MNIEQLKRFLPYALKANAAVMVHGLHGIGKSQTIKQFAKENGYEFIDRRLSQMESGDLLGLPSLEKGRTSFFTPDWLPQDPNSKGILFLDEINRARPDVLQGVFQLVLDRQLGNYTLPEGWKVISAVNPNTDDYDVTNVFDEALLDRFLHVKLTPTEEEYISYLRTQSDLDQNMVSFLQMRPELIENSKLNVFSLERKPSRRSWTKAAEMYSMNLPQDIVLEGIGGLVGATNVSMYQAWLEENNVRPFKAEEILNDYKNQETKALGYADPSKGGRHDVLQATLDNIKTYIASNVGKLKDKQTKNLLSFMAIIPKDLTTAFLTAGLDSEDAKVKDYFLALLEDPATDDMILTREPGPDGKNDYDKIQELETLVEELKKGNK